MVSESYVTLSGSHHPPPAGARRLGEVPDDQTITVSLYLASRDDPAALERAAPGERRERLAHHRAERHADAIGLIRNFAAHNGLTVVLADPARRLVQLSGPAGRMAAAFHTSLAHYHDGTERFHLPAGPVSLPADLHAVVESVLGLDTRPVARPRLVRVRFAPTRPGFLPNQVAQLYGFPTAPTGAGQTVALLEFGGGFQASDTNSAFHAMGLPPPRVTAVPVDGASNQPNVDQGADGEVALDIQVVGGAAPGTHIAVYFAPNSEAGFANAISAASHDQTNKPSVISISWGGAESQWSSQGTATINSLLQDAATLGISVFAACGDALATDGMDDGKAHVVFPASSPWAIGCGGTQVTTSGNAIADETVWNDGTSGTGGGISDLFPVPDFQKSVTLPPSANGSGGGGGGSGRGVPDVAADASPETGYTIVVDGRQGVTGGTSAVAPLWAGLIALVNQKAPHPAGFFLPTLYRTGGLTRQITQGNNRPEGSSIGYDAGGSWNPCTGLGVPVGQALFDALTGGNAAAATTEARMTAPTASAGGPTPADQPYFDPTAYGNGPDDNVTDATENAAVTHHTMVLGGRTIAYTATAGHLVTVDPSSSKPDAKIFYVAFTEDGADRNTRPVTFFYNGGPGSSSVYLLLGSFAPSRIHTNMPVFTPPAPYTTEPNPDSLLDKTDLVFINPVGTGYSAAVAPRTNKDFWGVDQDAGSLKQFIKRYLTANDRWNSPKFLFGESYGTARSCVLAYALHEDGVELNGVVLQSSILDYAKAGNPIGLLPTWAADAWYHKRVRLAQPPADLPGYMDRMSAFADTAYAQALKAFPQSDKTVVTQLSQEIGIDETTLLGWQLNVAAANQSGTALFLVTLLQDKGRALGAYDGRVTGVDTGIAGHIDPRSGGNDPTMTAVNGVYTACWNTYLNDTLKFTSNSAYTDLNDQAFAHWDFHHTDPTGAERGIDAQGNVILYTAGDLAAVMSLNVDLKVLSANGYYDSVTPFHQTVLDLAAMPVEDAGVRQNLTVRYYPSGHMIYLDGGSRTAMKAELVKLYDSTVADRAAHRRILERQNRRR